MRRLGVLLAAGLLLATPAATLDGETTGEPSLRERFEELLFRTADASALAEDIAGLGPEVVPLLARALAGKPTHPETGAPAAPGILLAAAELLGRDACLAHLGAPAEGHGASSVATIRLLGVVAEPEDVELLLGVAHLDGTSASADAAHALEEALHTILLRHPGEIEGWLDARFEELPVAEGALVVRSFADAAPRSALGWLCAALGRRADLDPALLSAVESATRSLAPPFDETVRGAVREVLEREDVQLVRRAIRIVGFLDDYDAIERLIELLDPEEPLLSGEAHSALTHITGLSVPPSPARWSAWHESERQWFGVRAPELFAQLQHSYRGKVVGALQELSAHRYRRHLIAAEVAGLLGHDSPAMRALACGALAGIGSWTSVGPLIDALDDADDEVRAQAHVALRRITALDLAADRAAWAQALPAEALDPARGPILVARRR